MLRLLIVAETDGSHILPPTMPAVAFAQRWQSLTGGEFDILLIGGSAIVQETGGLADLGASAVYSTEGRPDLEHPIADQAANLIANLASRGYDFIAGPSTQFGRDVLPRVASLLGRPMLSDVMAIDSGPDGLTYKRPMFAGNVIATVSLDGDSGVFSIRTTSFAAPHAINQPGEVRVLDVPKSESATRWIGLDAPKQTRPELTSARVVVSGGRPLRDAQTFEKVIGGLADKLGGAAGATRAAVDTGIAPNELQVGQTGKIVAPELYIAAGISGSVQHLAGMKDSKVIVAINTDPEAPIFEAADYGLVADLFQAIPELIARL